MCFLRTITGCDSAWSFLRFSASSFSRCWWRSASVLSWWARGRSFRILISIEELLRWLSALSACTSLCFRVSCFPSILAVFLLCFLSSGSMLKGGCKSLFYLSASQFQHGWNFSGLCCLNFWWYRSEDLYGNPRTWVLDRLYLLPQSISLFIFASSFIFLIFIFTFASLPPHLFVSTLEFF